MVVLAPSAHTDTDTIPAVEQTIPHRPHPEDPASPEAPAHTDHAPTPSEVTAPSLPALAAHTGYRISYRNRCPYVVAGSHLLGTLLGAPLHLPGTDTVWVPIRPYLNLVGHAVALIHPDDIRTIFTTRTGQHTHHPSTAPAGAPHPSLQAPTDTGRHTWHSIPRFRQSADSQPPVRLHPDPKRQRPTRTPSPREQSLP